MQTPKLLHWNILYEESPQNILSLIKEVDPDIFCCQEINDRTDLLKETAQILPYYYFEPADIKGVGDVALPLGNAIFSKFPIKSKKLVVLWDGPNPTLGNPQEKRIYIEAKLVINGKGFSVGTTHLSFAPAFKDTPERSEQAKKLMEAIGGNKSNFAISGDFNSAPDTQIIKSIESQLVSAGPDHGEPTFTTIPFSFAGFEATGLEWRVDYIFTSPDIKVKTASIISTKYSDHLPILAELEI